MVKLFVWQIHAQIPHFYVPVAFFHCVTSFKVLEQMRED